MVLPVPKPPGMAAVPPLPMGKKVSMIRWPVIERLGDAQALADGPRRADRPLLEHRQLASGRPASRRPPTTSLDACSRPSATMDFTRARDVRAEP